MPPKQKKPPAPAASDFEYCDVCRRNHDQGRRHRYFPAHRAALAAALARFRSKLADLRASLLHTSPPRPDHPHRLWCLFCSVDLPDDLGSRFACSNAIYHLASGEHLRGVKDFLRKHGGGMDLVDSFRISEAELAKWVKDCESLNAGAETLNEGLIGPSLGPLKAMGRITLLVQLQRVMELLVLVVFPILLSLEPANRTSHLGNWFQHKNRRVH